MASKKVEREYIAAISIDSGIITLIEPTGSVSMYRQRGIGSLDANSLAWLIRTGRLNQNWERFKELPRNWTIEFEDEEIMGKARATFPIPKEIKNSR